ncbi:MAG: ATP-binding protein [Chloroflexi bacterium]|nr:ATP-binding protein [Chloroflexota bacterium]
MNNFTRGLASGLLALLVLTGLVVAFLTLILSPSQGDLVALTGFLLISGGLTLVLGLTISQRGWPHWGSTLRVRLLLTSATTATLAMVNIGFTAVLMFLSPHDLAILVGLLGFSLGLSVFLAASLSASTVRSFQQLVSGVSQISTGNLTARVPVQSRDEVGRLASAFNNMAERLEESFSRQRDLEQARRDLIGSVSHDLRTPLASIRAMVESINDGVVTDADTVTRYLHNIESEVENLSQLINDLFELSQLDAGVLSLNLEISSLPDLISDTLESMSAQADASSKKLNLKGSVEGELSNVVTDARRMQRVLYNLVQNAVRYTPSDGTIQILARDTGAEVQVEVTDTGEGIPDAELPRIFDRFYRTEQSRSRDSGGAGLGLSIAKGIVEAHGGRLWVKSALGEGSTFGFALPKKATVSKVRS